MGSSTSRRRRALVVLPAGGALLASAFIGLPAQAAVTGPIDCPQPLPTAQAVTGLTGTGFTVSHGTTPDPFTAKVLGRIKDGIGPGVDMIMAELDSPALDAAGGVWAGMSGSPVYTDDGHLIGSVSYGLAASSPIAGITPAETMVPLLTGDTPTSGSDVAATVKLAASVKVSGTQAKSLAKVSGLALATTSRGFTQLTLPLGVSGSPSASGQKVLDRFEKKAGRVSVFNGGGTATATVTPAAVGAVHAAGNFAGVLSYGDASFYGVGTTTFVCNGRAVAFGHPFDYVGDTKLGANLADTIYVQPDPVWGPFKVTNITDTVGTVDLDSLTGIAGTLGTAPSDMINVKSKLTNGAGHTFTGGSQVAATDFAPDIAAYTTVYDVERALGASSKGSGAVTITIKGKRADGSLFTVSHGQKYVDTYNLPYALADTVYVLVSAVTQQDAEKVTVTDISVSGTVTRAINGYKVSKLEVYRGGTWKRASSGPFSVNPGSKLSSRVTLAPLGGGTATHSGISFTVPNLAGSGYVSLEGGSDPWSWDLEAETFPDLIHKFRVLPKSDRLYGVLRLSTESGGKTLRSNKLVSKAMLPFGDLAEIYTF